ncbi:hypothetical protein PsYK624_024800 [Phanerochaete sordida]|uniref:Uncharacterized protein n=1 Tax=Phanerochaete sordida TaxID=48140 RepID=A0A9P3G2C7_9APHY|nr:hypothetical protein PsYK624_024800 [Phanerochaete sordida]
MPFLLRSSARRHATPSPPANVQIWEQRPLCQLLTPHALRGRALLLETALAFAGAQSSLTATSTEAKCLSCGRKFA